MILRRFMQHVREQNWFAVVLDFAIVVSGVLLAFQITAWNEMRRDRRDEAAYLERLHADVMLAESGSARVRERRLAVVEPLRSAIEIVFELSDRNSLNEEECRALGSASAVYLNVLELAAFNELSSAGRIGILRDEELRAALIEFQQLSASLNHHMLIQNMRVFALDKSFPHAFSRRPRFEPGSTEIRGETRCDLDAMRSDPAFMQAAFGNADDYDAFVRDQLRPWSDKLTEVHERLDRRLGLTHAGDAP